MLTEHSIGLFTALFLFFSAGAVGWGAIFLRITRLSRLAPDRLTLLFFSGALGTLIQADFFLLAGALGLIQSGVFALIIICGIIPGGVFLFHEFRRLPAHEGQAPRRSELAIFLVLSLPALLWIYSANFLPDVSGDAYLYHVTVPNYYVREGGIVPAGASFCYNYPLTLEMYVMAGIAMNQVQAGIMMNLGLVALGALGLYLSGRLMRSPRAGLLAAFFFLSTPLTLIWGGTSLADVSAAPYMAGALLGYLYWKKSKVTAWLFPAGLCAGGAVTMKLLTAAPVLILAAGIAVASCMKKDDRGRGRLLAPALFCLAAALAYAPWMIKNAAFAGNPLFPFFLNLFPTRPELLASAEELHSMHGVPPPLPLKKTVARSLELFSLLAWDKNVIPALGVILSPLLFARSLFKKERRVFWGVLAAMALFILYYGKNAQVRWFQGVFALFSLGCAVAALRLLDARPGLKKPALLGGAILLFAMAGLVCRTELRESGAFPWLAFSRKSRTRYVESRHRFWRARTINRALPPEGKVFLYDVEIMSTGRWLRRRFVQGGMKWFDWMESRGADWRETHRELRRMGVTHVAILQGIKHNLMTELKEKRLTPSPGAGDVRLYVLEDDDESGSQIRRSSSGGI